MSDEDILAEKCVAVAAHEVVSIFGILPEERAEAMQAVRAPILSAVLTFAVCREKRRWRQGYDLKPSNN